MRVSLQSQIAALASAVDGSAWGVTQAQQELHREHMRAALRTLKCLIKNEQLIRERCPELDFDLVESERRP